MQPWHTGIVQENHFWTDDLFTLTLDYPHQDFIAGQFVRLAMEIDGKRIQRAYSLVNAPGSGHAELYLTRVADGLLSPALAELAPGDPLEISTPNGFFTLDEVPKGRNLWLLATGTGIGPYLSMLDTDEPWQRFERIILVHGVRTQSNLVYQERIQNWLRKNPLQLHYQPVLSQEESGDALHGRIPQLIEAQILQAAAGLPITPHSQVMLCGNPAMIKETRSLLESMGLSKNLRRSPGQITAEQYW